MLSESDKQFIKANVEKGVDWLLEQTKRTKKEIENFISTIKVNPKAERVRKKMTPTKGVSVMSQGVSEIVDEVRKTKRNTADYIYKIRKDEDTY